MGVIFMNAGKLLLLFFLLLLLLLLLSNSHPIASCWSLSP